MTTDNSIAILTDTFLIGESVFIGYFSSQIEQIINSGGNQDAILILMIVIFVLYSYLKSPIVYFLEWIWFNRNPFEADNDENYEEEFTGKRWGAKHMQTTIRKLLEVGALFLLQIVFIIFVFRVFDYWEMNQYSTFDSIYFVIFFFATWYSFLGIVQETIIK